MAVESLMGLNSYINEQMKAWKVPGLSVVVVQDGEVIMMESYGHRNIAQDLPVTHDTVFAIGSSTKAFTALAAGILVDEAKIDLDTPVKEYLPQFKMYDDYVSQRITIRDMLCHRSGLPRHELMWYNSPFTRDEIIDRLQYLEPNIDFRSKWQYQNIMYMVAGYIIGHVCNSSWEEVVQDRILNPLGMSSSQFSVDKTKLQDDYALPYAVHESGLQAVSFRNIDIMGPAGSINANIKDMAHWVKFQMNLGMFNGERIVSQDMLATLHMPQMVGGIPGINQNNMDMSCYGLGWTIEPYRGSRMVHHGGNIDGFSAHVAFMPIEKTGVVVLSNLNGTPLPMFIANHIFDRLLGGEVDDWSGQSLERMKKASEFTESTPDNTEKKSGEEAVRPLKTPLMNLVGNYEHPGYGTMVIELVETGLQAIFNSMTFPITHVDGNLFELNVVAFELKTNLTFHTDLNGRVNRLSAVLLFETGANEIEFSKNEILR